MKSKIKEIQFSVSLYRADVSVFYDGSFEEFKRIIEERHGDAKKFSFGELWEWGEDADTTDAYMFQIAAKHGIGERFYIWILQKDMYLLSHEVFHLTGDILHHRGVKYSMDSEESFSYLHCWLMDEIFKLMKGKL